MINYYFNTREWAEEGSHFVGLIAGNVEFSSRRSFIRSRLVCGLRKGHQYKLQFYLRSKHPVYDSVGVYFSSTDFLFEKKPYTQLHPALVFRDTIASSNMDDHEWKKVSFSYIATGEEIFITIGSFRKQEPKFKFQPDYKGNYYLYLDAVSMYPMDMHELLCAGADSMRSVIYEQDERHSLLERKIILNRRNVPQETPPPVTSLQRIDTLIIPDILFSTASSALNEISFHVLDSFSVALASRKIDSMIVNGHTDSVGTLTYNNKLSSDRALSVFSYIKKKSSLDNNLFIIRYYAYLRPVAPNLTAAGRQRNRRVEIYLYSRE